MKELYARFATFEAGHECEKEEAKEIFIIGQYYKVDKVDMGGSHTDIYLKGFEGYFNSVFFKFYIRDKFGKFVKHDIFEDPDYNPYIKKKTYTFTGVDGKERTFNIGDLVIDSDGEIGKIVDFCCCSKCKERGFYEVLVEYQKAEDCKIDYITVYAYERNFTGQYKIGNEVFGEKPKKEDIEAHISRFEKYISEYTNYLDNYKQLLDDLYTEK